VSPCIDIVVVIVVESTYRQRLARHHAAVINLKEDSIYCVSMIVHSTTIISMSFSITIERVILLAMRSFIVQGFRVHLHFQTVEPREEMHVFFIIFIVAVRINRQCLTAEHALIRSSVTRGDCICFANTILSVVWCKSNLRTFRLNIRWTVN
jgi:hypothetical protein